MIRWSDPLYEADRRVATVGTVMIGYVVPPDRTVPHWRWFLTFTRVEPDGRAVSEMYARRAVSRRWVEWIVEAGLTLTQDEGHAHDALGRRTGNPQRSRRQAARAAARRPRRA